MRQVEGCNKPGSGAVYGVLFLPWLGATSDIRKRQFLPHGVNRTNLPGIEDSGSVPVGPESSQEHTDGNYLSPKFNKD